MTSSAIIRIILLYIYLDVRIILYYIDALYYIVHDVHCIYTMTIYYLDDSIQRKEQPEKPTTRGKNDLFGRLAVVFTSGGHVLYSGPPVGPRIVSRLEVFVCYESLTPAGPQLSVYVIIRTAKIDHTACACTYRIKHCSKVVPIRP